MKKIDQKTIQKIVKLYSTGMTDEQVSLAVDICRKTLHNWKVNNPDLLHSIKEAKDVVNDLVEVSLFNRAVGYTYESEKLFLTRDGRVVRAPTLVHVPPDVTSQIFWLKNRRPERWRDVQRTEIVNVDQPKDIIKLPFEKFAENAGYPAPFPQQVEMMKFGMDTLDPRLLLGARGYGKTDYITILGTAYDIYCDWVDYMNKAQPEVRSTNLIISKSKTRNTAMIEEIAAALKANGVPLEKENSTCVRVQGLIGKDHSAEVLTIKSSFRGRHPKRILMDDPVTEEDTSDAMRNLVKKKYDEAYKLCKNICVIGQPAHIFDLYSELRSILNKMEVAHGSIPELDADLEAMKMAGVDERSIQMSYHLQVPADADNALSKVQFCDDFPTTGSVAFIDPSFEGGDYTALTVLTMSFHNVIVEGYVWKKAWNHCIDEMVQKMEALNVGKVCIETNSLGDQPVSLLRQKVARMGVVGKKSLGNKHARIMAAGVFADKIFISKRSDKKYIDQVIKYEYKAQHDDAPDSLASCMEWVGIIKGQRKS